MARKKGSQNKVNKIQQAVEAQVEQPLFSPQHSSLVRQVKPLFQFPPDTDANFEIKLKWFMTKDNLFYETITYYWLTQFYKEYPYMNIDYIKKELHLN